MNLIIDEGNTNAKVSLYEDGRQVLLLNTKELSVEMLERLVKEYNATKSIYSSTRNMNAEVCEYLERATKFVLFDSETKVPLDNKYKTPKTLGRDRLAACVGANTLRPNETSLVIDIGTAITYDVVSEGAYLGGNIAPGMQMRLDALHHFTARLPQVDIESEYVEIGETTESAIYSGCKSGIIYEIEGYFGRLMLKYPKVSVFLTGGGAKYFVNQINFKIFALSNDINAKESVVVEPNLVEIGLERILMYQC